MLFALHTIESYFSLTIFLYVYFIPPPVDRGDLQHPAPEPGEKYTQQDQKGNKQRSKKRAAGPLSGRRAALFLEKILKNQCTGP